MHCTWMPHSQECLGKRIRLAVSLPYSLPPPPRTVHKWHSSLVVKRVFFECFDCFMPLFYIAFYQLDVVTLRAEIASLFTSEPSCSETLLSFFQTV